MSRPVGPAWEPLADSDPVPGDPGAVNALSRDLRRIADGLQQQAARLRALATDDSWQGKAGPQFRATAVSTATRLEQVYRRYDAAASAIGGYAPDLEDAQQQSLTLLHQAQDAGHELDRYDRQLRTADAAGQVDTSDYQVLTARREVAAEAVATARQRLAAITDQWRAAARTAADAIDDIIDSDGLSDGFWDKTKDWIHRNAGWIRKLADICSWVATICGTLALVLSFIPVIGQALAAVLGAIALIATAIALVCHLALALSGDGSWVDVGIDMVALATFGLGRAVIGGVRAGASALRGGLQGHRGG